MTTTKPDLDDMDRITIDLLFALRDSLTDVSRLDFWTGRATTALTTAAAGASTWAEAVTIAAHKLQIDVLTNGASETVARLGAELGDFEAWSSHVDRNIVYIVALANTERDSRKPTRQPAEPISAATTEEIPF
jgi:hypothetical protein